MESNAKSQLRLSHDNPESPREVHLAHKERASFSTFRYKVLQSPGSLLQIRVQLKAPYPRVFWDVATLHALLFDVHCDPGSFCSQKAIPYAFTA
jgi:hypothetical protein